jgi:DHA2 family multidrug resistance protein
VWQTLIDNPEVLYGALSAFVIVVLLTPAVGGMARRLGAVDQPDGRRKVHSRPIPLAGGIGVLAANSILQGMAIGIIWVPLTMASFTTLDSRFWPEAMAVFHLLRNIGSSFFISVCVADIVRVTAQNYSRMNEMISPYNDRLSLPWVMGGWSTETLPGLARLAKEVNRQAAMIGYLNAFSLYTVTSIAAIAVVWLARRKRAIDATRS